MADDGYRKPIRADDTFGRTTGAGSGSMASDPLAELARLIGQTDPFGEFGQTSRAPSAGSHPQQSPPSAAYPSPSRASRDDLTDTALAGGSPQFGLPLGAQPRIPDDYVSSNVEPVYEPAAYDMRNGPGFDPGAFSPGRSLTGEDASYDDIPPPRRRLGVMVIAGVFALVVIGTAGALGFRTLFGPSGVTPPPVVKAETTPSKVVPATSTAQSEKLINERIGDRSRDEKLVSREERPLALAGRSDASQAGVSGSVAGQPVTASGPTRIEELYEPKKVKTVAIRPDQPTAAPVGDAVASARPAAAAPAAPVATQRPAARAGSEPLSISSIVERDDNRPPAASAAARPTANGPLSLTPGTPAAASPQPAQAPRVASAPAGNGGAGGYAVQISSQRSEAEAVASFRSMQGRFPSQLGDRQPIIRRADLGSKGVYYRAMVGPFSTAGDAAQLCDGIKAAGGQCLIQRF